MKTLNMIDKDGTPTTGDALVIKWRDFWSNVGKKHGWSMDNIGVTIWINEDMEYVDSYPNPVEHDLSFIVDRETEDIIKTIKWKQLY